MRGIGRLVVVLGVVLFLAVPSVDAQYFGRNKVQWESFNFHVLKTEHFDIYYYPEDNQAVQDAAQMAERWYDRMSALFEFQLPERTPIIFYANHADFQQTTVTGGLISEGTGGFTEGLKNRLVMPLTVSYADTDHVLGHEMVHVFQYSIAKALFDRGPRQQGLGRLPLWMIEGLAEYLSVGQQDAHTAMWLRDAVAQDNIPTLGQLSRDPRFFPYRWGHAFWAYIGGRWGDKAVARFFVNSMTLGPGAALEEVLGMTEKELTQAWHAAIRETYAPVVRASQPVGAIARPVLHEGAGEALNLAPVISPDGKRVAFLSTRDLFSIDLFLADAETGDVRGKLVSSAGDPHFDALRFIDSSGTWSPDSQRFAFVVFAKGDNQLAIADAGSRDVVQRLAPKVGAINDPSWSPDGRWIAFSGTRKGIADLFLVDVSSGEIRQLTDDRHADLQPTWTLDGRSLVFVSDRGPQTSFAELRYGPFQLSRIDIASGAIETYSIFPAPTKHINPQFGPAGELYFIADPTGVSNIFGVDLASGEVWQVTDVSTGVTGITDASPAMSVARSTGRLYFTVFDAQEYRVYSLPSAPRIAVDPQQLATRRAAYLPPLDSAERGLVNAYLEEIDYDLPEPEQFEVSGYDPKLSLDFIGSPGVGVGVDRYGYGLGGGISAYFSDILGRHQVGAVIQGGSSSNYGNTFGGQVTYLNRTSRFNWGVVGASVPFVSAFTSIGTTTVVDPDGNEFVADRIEQIREEVRLSQAALIGQYPLNLNQRFEASVGYNHYNYDRTLDGWIVYRNTVVDRYEQDLPAPESVELIDGSVAFVGDTSFYAFTSPVRGTRYRLEVGSAVASQGDLDVSYQTALADYRRYVQIGNPVSFAFRGLHFGRYGMNDEERGLLAPLVVGRETLVRGYDVGSWDPEDECTALPGDGSSCAEFDRLVGDRIALVNLELRTQLLGAEQYGLVNMPYLPTELVAFFDAGLAWSQGDDPELRWDTDTIERVPVASAGVAARILLGGYVPIEVYYAFPFHRPEKDGVFGFVISPGW